MRQNELTGYQESALRLAADASLLAGARTLIERAAAEKADPAPKPFEPNPTHISAATKLPTGPRDLRKYVEELVRGMK